MHASRLWQPNVWGLIILAGIGLLAGEPKNAAMEVTPVEETVTVIRERSLLHNNAVASSASGGALSVSQGFANRGTDLGGLLQEKADKTEQPNGTALYGFLLQPGERVLITKSGDNPGKVLMRFVEPLQPNAMTSMIQRVNRAPRPLRAHRVELENVLSEPFHMILLLYGEVGYPYALKIERHKTTK